MVANWENPFLKSPAKNRGGETKVSRFVAKPHDLKPKVRAESSQSARMIRMKKNSPKRIGTSSQSLKNRITRHLTARACCTCSVTSSENGQTIVRRRTHADRAVILPMSLIAPSVSLRHSIAMGDNKYGNLGSNLFILQGLTG